MKHSIEYAHIYTNQHISEEHELSLKVLKGVVEGIKGQNNDHSLVVLVDDYSFPDTTFDYENFAKWLKTKGFEPNLLLRESQLIPVCDDVLSLINDQKLKQQIGDYIKTKKKYPCSLFIAAWYLLRLGKVSSPVFPPELRSDTLVNILPDSFKPFEDKGLDIIRAAGFTGSIDNIQYKFLEGRLLA